MAAPPSRTNRRNEIAKWRKPGAPGTGHRELLERLEARGIASRQTRALAPGELPVQTVKPDAIQQPDRARRRQASPQRQQREL